MKTTQLSKYRTVHTVHCTVYRVKSAVLLLAQFYGSMTENITPNEGITSPKPDPDSNSSHNPNPL